MNLKYFSFIVLPMMLLGLSGAILMVLTQSYIWLLLTLLFWILLSGLGTGAGFHRTYSHCCYDPKPWLDNLLLVLGTFACQSSSITWVATHIGYHHPYADTDKDPHTPKKGIWYSFMWWTSYVTATTVNHKYAVRLLRKPNHVFFHKNYFRIIWITLIISFFIFGWKPVLFGYCIAAMISMLQDFSVNVLGHWPSLGYRNYETDDISSNFAPLGYLGWGQGWHNNHHKYPARFNFGIKWWEFDPCRIFIPLMKLGSNK